MANGTVRRRRQVTCLALFTAVTSTSAGSFEWARPMPEVATRTSSSAVTGKSSLLPTIDDEPGTFVN